MVSDVAAATGLTNDNAAGLELRRRRDDVRRAAPRAHAERDDRWMFEQEQRVADLSASSILDQSALQFQRFVVIDAAETANRQPRSHADLTRCGAYNQDSSKCSSLRLRACRNLPPSAPSIKRW